MKPNKTLYLYLLALKFHFHLVCNGRSHHLGRVYHRVIAGRPINLVSGSVGLVASIGLGYPDTISRCSLIACSACACSHGACTIILDMRLRNIRIYCWDCLIPIGKWIMPSFRQFLRNMRVQPRSMHTHSKHAIEEHQDLLLRLRDPNQQMNHTQLLTDFEEHWDIYNWDFLIPIGKWIMSSFRRRFSRIIAAQFPYCYVNPFHLQKSYVLILTPVPPAVHVQITPSLPQIVREVCTMVEWNCDSLLFSRKPKAAWNLGWVAT